MQDWVSELTRLLADTPVQSDPDVVASYARDQAPLAPAGCAMAVVHARTVDDVVTVLKFANARGIPVVTRGAGTGLAGGANAIDGCIVLSVKGLDKILSIDPQTRTAVVQPGVLNGRLAAEASALGLYYAPDPASREISTIGGNIATNAGGSCCLKYGVTGDHVAALKVVMADGTLLKTGAITQKNVASIDLNRLFVGSEGALGVIVEATVRLKRKPKTPSTLVAMFDTVQQAASAIVAMEANDDLSLIEMMDQITIDAVERHVHMELDTSAAALVLVQSDAPDSAEAVKRCEARCLEHGGRDIVITDDAEEGRLLLHARRMALPALEKMGTTLLDDVAVPKPALPAMFERIAAIAAKHALTIGTFGHAGDGNLHPTIVFNDPESEKRARIAFEEIIHAALELGGTISGEHGIGTLKEAYVTPMIGAAERDVGRRIKAALDPRNILNPGKKI